MTKIIGQREDFLRKSIDDYYQYNPDTLMPLLMLALATQGRLSVENDVKNGTVFASISIDEVLEYDWVKLNPALKKRLRETKAGGGNEICVVGQVPAELRDIYETFRQYDTVTVVQEYHHRKGILVHHSSNSASEKAQRQYATLLFAEELIAAQREWLNKSFIRFANIILVESGIQPRRPRIRVAQALCILLKYDGKGTVYNPFAGCALAGAMIDAGKNLYADGDANDKLLAAARLLCYGTGQRGYNIEKRDSLKWLKDIKADYVLSTFLGYPGGKSAFDICLGHCLEDFKESGKFAGIASPKDIFENQSDELKEALRRDWIDTIVLLPFGEVAVLVDAAKAIERRKKIRFFNLTHPMLCRRPLFLVLEDEDYYAEVLRVSDVKKKGYLKSLVTPEIEQQEGCELITLGDIYEKIPRLTWSLNRVPAEDRVLAKIDRKWPYNEWRRHWMQGIEKEPIVSLFAPAYKLDQESLIVNSKGDLEPRLFDAQEGNAFFQDGLAFRRKELKEDFDHDWLVHELCQPYVRRQLYPYGVDDMVPENITEDLLLSVKLNRPLIDEPEFEEENEKQIDPEEAFKIERKKNKLPSETKIQGGNVEYTIHRYLGAGHFGYAYTALAHNLSNGQEKEVVLKELFPYKTMYREGKLGVIEIQPYFDMDIVRVRFKEEYEIMKKLGKISNSYVVQSESFFESPDTNTLFYTMPFYQDGSLDDLRKSGFSFDEEMMIKHIVYPLCKALRIAHDNNVLHLDIKPENILINKDGYAMLTDFGVAKKYDKHGNIINGFGPCSTGIFAAPELKTKGGERMTHFGSQPDIFGMAATLYFLSTNGGIPHPIMDFGEEDEDIRENLEAFGFTKQFADAIVAGLEYLSRPRNAQEFLNLFPGCEDIKL